MEARQSKSAFKCVVITCIDPEIQSFIGFCFPSTTQQTEFSLLHLKKERRFFLVQLEEAFLKNPNYKLSREVENGSGYFISPT
jgi:hypothetical protein